MTPRHLSMFCVAQIAVILLGVSMLRVLRKSLGYYEANSEWNVMPPSVLSWVADQGWLLLLAPLWCVLAIPRHREEQDEVKFTPLAITAICAGLAAIFLPVLCNLEIFSRMIR